MFKKFINWIKSRFQTTEATPSDVKWTTVLKTIWSWSSRNLVLILIGYIALLKLNWEPVAVYLGIKTTYYFSMTIILSGLGLWAYTRFDFLRTFIRGRNNQTDTDNEYKFATGIIIAMLLTSAYIVGKVLDAQSQIENNRMLEPEEISYTISRMPSTDQTKIYNQLDSLIKSDGVSK